MQDVYIVEAVRTPVGKIRGVFKNERPDDLLVHCLKALLNRVPRVPKESISDVMIGCAMPEGAQGMNVARIASLLAGLGDSVPGMTLNRFCASGLEAIALAASRIATGQADFIIAGGIESMSQVPMGGFSPSINPRCFLESEHLAIAYGMGITAERVAERWHISRAAQDAFAVRSHARALSAIQKGAFKSEIAPYKVRQALPNLRTGEIETLEKIVDHDQGPRICDEASIGHLRPVFALDGSITAATASQMSDGAGVVLVASAQAVADYQLKPLAKFRSYAVVGVAPEVMGIGPVAAIPKCLAAAGVTLNEIDWIELNEAFAAQVLAVIQELGLKEALVNPLGGAIALGHPLGATGAIRTATLCHGLRNQQLKYGIVSMCIGTGMGAAALFERV